MTCLGKWVLASAVLLLLAVTGAGMLSSLAQKPAAVIDLSQLGHSCREPAARQGCFRLTSAGSARYKWTTMQAVLAKDI